MKKIACSIALLIAASVAVAEELFTFVNDGDGYGYSYIRINQDLDSFSFSSDWHSLGNVGKVGYVVYTADMSEIDCAAYMEANANNPEFGKNINGGEIDLGALKAGDRVGFYEVRPNGSTYTRSAFNEWKDQLWLAFGKGGSDTKDEWMTIEDIKAVSAGGSSPCDSVAVSNVVARQRWPWNGLVDVDYEISSYMAGLKVEIDFDEQGGRHWAATNFLAGAEPTLKAGHNRATWDAKADGVTNVLANVVATVKLIKGLDYSQYDFSSCPAVKSNSPNYLADNEAVSAFLDDSFSKVAQGAADTIVFPNVSCFFEHDDNGVGEGAELTAEGRAVLKTFASRLALTDMESSVLVEGYTCDIGSVVDDDERSQRRAETVKVEIAKYIPASKVTAKWYGKRMFKKFKYDTRAEYDRVNIRIQ